ncbi:MAG: His Kinase (phospho-acceptor) protein [Myxococcales bacterium]|nr:His Kinase (phospho-acceptor) protein [Myxococcales bacterium]
MPSTILIVDDDVDARELLRLYLHDAGYDTVEAVDGEQAVELADTAAPDLVLMDVMLPRMNGFEAARRCKQLRSGEFLPIIMVTSLRDQSSKLLGYRVGVDDFLSHPVDRIELGVRVAGLLALRERHQSLMKRNEELAELQRFRDEMSSTVVHDLKNPLAVILANLAYAIEELRQAGEIVDPDVGQSLVESEEAGRRLLRLLTNLADTARIEANRLEAAVQPAPVGRILTQIAMQRRVLAHTRDIKIDVRVPVEVEAALDVDLVTRAIENIVDNALRYTPSGGKICMMVSRESDGDDFGIAIANDGPPIPLESRHAIFEKYGQSAGKRSGRMNLGLGLYFCRLAAEAHGGTLELSDTPEFSTVFTFRLPVTRRVRRRSTGVPEQEMPADDSRKTNH